MAHIHNHCLIAGGALLCGHASELLEKLVAIAGICSIGASKAGIVNTRSPLQVIDLEARVISDRRKARQGCGIAGFNNAVFDKAESRLLNIGNIELGLGNHLNAQLVEHLLQFFYLARIGTRQYQLIISAQSISLRVGVSTGSNTKEC